MFVPPASLVHPPFPAKPKPLQPVFSFAQSQSCMSLAMDILDRTEHAAGKPAWTETSEGRFEVLAPARPRSAYKSPLQRIGEALRTPQAGSAATLPELVTNSAAGGVSGIGFALPALHPNPHSQSDEQSPSCEFPNYSYKLVPGGKRSPTRSALKKDAEICSGRGYDGPTGTGTVSCPTPKGQINTPRNDRYFAGTSLLSSFFSNPRTRAPFKPQKSNRGTSSWQLKQYAEATLGSGSLRKAVKLPEGEDKDEWLAVNGRQDG